MWRLCFQKSPLKMCVKPAIIHTSCCTIVIEYYNVCREVKVTLTCDKSKSTGEETLTTLGDTQQELHYVTINKL